MNDFARTYRRDCLLGALGAALMLVGDLCLSVIPASAGDSGLFLRAAYFDGAFQPWRLPLLIAAEPTRGVDIGAIEYIHNRLVEKRTQGDAVLLISSELTEIMELSDRIYVVYEGRIVGEFTRETASEEKLGLLMMGGVQA